MRPETRPSRTAQGQRPAANRIKGLFEIRHAVDARCKEIAGGQHLPWQLDIARFAGCQVWARAKAYGERTGQSPQKAAAGRAAAMTKYRSWNPVLSQGAGVVMYFHQGYAILNIMRSTDTLKTLLVATAFAGGLAVPGFAATVQIITQNAYPAWQETEHLISTSPGDGETVVSAGGVDYPEFF